MCQNDGLQIVPVNSIQSLAKQILIQKRAVILATQSFLA